MSFYTSVTLSAKAPEFNAVLKQSPTVGSWTATIRTTRGQVETRTYATEAAMRKDLSSRSAYQVQFIKNTEAGERMSGVDLARQEMLATNPRKSDITKGLAKAPVIEAPTALEMAGYTPEEETGIIEGCFRAAIAIRTWFLNCEENRSTIVRYLDDNNMTYNSGNFGKAIDYLYTHNFLIRAERKRGEAPISIYVSPTAASETPDVRTMSTEELRTIERDRQSKAIAKIRKANPSFVSVATKKY